MRDGELSEASLTIQLSYICQTSADIASQAVEFGDFYEGLFVEE